MGSNLQGSSRFRAAFGCIAFLLLLSCQSHMASSTGEEHIELTLVDTAHNDFTVGQRVSDAQFTRETGIIIKPIVGSESTAGMLNEQREWLRSGSPVPDVCHLDNVWAGSLGKFLIDLKPYIPEKTRADLIPEVLRAYEADGRLIAVPAETSFPLLYYRTDLLKKYGFSAPPKTWDELERMALVIQTGERRSGNRDFWGYLWEGAAAETLTCVGQEYQVSSGGGHMLEADGSVSVNNSRAAQAFERAAHWINYISPPGTPAYLEGDVTNVWEAGNGAFARNWNETFAADQGAESQVRGKVGVALLPHDSGFPSASTVGGWGYGVSKHSRHPKEAARLVEYLTSRSRQSWRLQHVLQLPAFTSLYSDPWSRDSLLFLKPLQGNLFRSAVARPSATAGSRYLEISRAYAEGIHAILTGKVKARAGVASMAEQMAAILAQRSAD